MPPIVRTAAIGVGLAILIALYATRLQFSPVAIMHDETKFALQAQSIAATGRDLTGRLLPVYFTEPEFPAGRDPVIIYATALVLKVLPLSESSARLATSLVGVLNVGLMFLVGRRLFKSDALGLVAAILLALTPVHFIRSRMVLSPLYSIPFILAWLLWLARFAERPERRTLAIAAAWLGAGLYTYLACVVMMPVYLGLTAAIAFRQRMSGWTAPLAAGFLVPIVPMAAWYLTHPERYAQIIEAYRLYPAEVTPLQGAAGFAASESIRMRLNLYWSFFSPEFLFMTGDTALVNSTRQVGFFPLAFAVLIPVGMFRLARKTGDLGKVILAGWLTAPLATVVSGAIEMNRIMFAIPFGVLVAAFGVKALLESKAAISKALCALLVAGCALQFAGFYADYMGRYRAASSLAFGGNTRSALTEAIARAGNGRIYLSRGIRFIDRYWRFYTISLNREDLLGRETLFDWPALDLHSVPANSVMVCRTIEPVCVAVAADAEWSLARAIREPDGEVVFSIFEKH